MSKAEYEAATKRYLEALRENLKLQLPCSPPAHDNDDNDLCNDDDDKAKKEHDVDDVNDY